MTATSSGRTGGGGQQKTPARRGLRHPKGGGATASDREGRSAAAAAGGVRVFEGEPGLLEVALVVQGHAVQVLRAEPVDEAAHAGALDDDVVVGGLVLDAEAVLEARAPARQHADAQAGGLGGHLLLRHELAHLDRRRAGQGPGGAPRNTFFPAATFRGGSPARRWSPPRSPPTPPSSSPALWRATASRATGCGGTCSRAACSPCSSTPGGCDAPA